VVIILVGGSIEFLARPLINPIKQNPMKQFLLLILCCLSLAVSAQRALLPGSSERAEALSPELVTKFANIPPVVSRQKAIIDTFFAPVFENTCALSPGIIGTTEGGFVTGSNGFGDLAKLQRINFPEPYNFELITVSAALFLDSVATFTNNLDDVMIVAKAYADNDDGTVGEFLGDSDSLRIGDLGLTNSTFSFIDFNFSTPVAFFDTESIIVGIDFRQINSSPDGNLGIISTDEGCGDGTNAFDVFFNQEGNIVFPNFFDSWDGLNIEMYINVVIDREPAVATRNPLANYGASVAPNPARDQLTITFNAPGNERMTASLLTTNGRVVRKRAVAPGVGTRTVNWNVDELPAGVYLYQISGPAGVETGRVIVR